MTSGLRFSSPGSTPSRPHGFNHISCTTCPPGMVSVSLQPNKIPPLQDLDSDTGTHKSIHLVDFHSQSHSRTPILSSSTYHPSDDRLQSYQMGCLLQQPQDPCPMVKNRTGIAHKPLGIARCYQGLPHFSISPSGTGSSGGHRQHDYPILYQQTMKDTLTPVSYTHLTLPTKA